MGFSCALGKSYGSWIVIKFLFFIGACYVFSVIFWGTKRWLDKKTKRRK